MPRRDPFVVLGVPPDAPPATIRAAWRRLARENHPDLAADPVAARRATRRMAEINAAYQELRDPERRRAGREAAEQAARSRWSADGVPSGSPSGKQPSGPPRPRPTRPVTGRLDTTELFEAFRMSAHRKSGGLGTLPGHQPLDRRAEQAEPPRASEPTGPALRRWGWRTETPVPDLGQARAVELGFGKFRGRTLGDVADFEPSYVDWIARTINHDPDLVAAARVLQADFDRRGIVRRHRQAPVA